MLKYNAGEFEPVPEYGGRLKAHKAKIAAVGHMMDHDAMRRNMSSHKWRIQSNGVVWQLGPGPDAE